MRILSLRTGGIGVLRKQKGAPQGSLTISALVTLLIVSIGCQQPEPQPESLPVAIPGSIDGISFGAGDWDPMLPAGERGRSWGNHRAVLQVGEPVEVGETVSAHIPWRRRDSQPDRKAVVVVDSASGNVVNDAVAVTVGREAGDLIFRAVSGAGTYYAYYYPYYTTGGYYPRVSYWTTDSLSGTFPATEEWIDSISTDPGRYSASRVTRIESINEFHSFFPMEVSATADEVEQFTTANPRAYYLFPEHRERPIRMQDQLPAHWMSGVRADSLFVVHAKRGEYFTFQVGVYSPAQDLPDLDISFDDLDGPAGSVISADALTCFNVEGVDLTGARFEKRVDVDAGQVQALWMGVDLPADIKPGRYTGAVVIQPAGMEGQSAPIALVVTAGDVTARGDNVPSKLSRLRWLNSTIGSDPEKVIKPFVPVTVESNKLSILGREIVLDPLGLPSNLRSFFLPEMTKLSDTPSEIIASPINLEVVANGRRQNWFPEPYTIRQVAAGRVEWEGESQSDLFEMSVSGSLEYDGMLDYHITLISKIPTSVSEISLPIVMEADAAKYMLGLGRTGRITEDSINWKWKVENHQEGVWLGNVHKGIQYVLRDENYERPLNTNFYLSKPLNMPPSWFNEGRGGITINSMGETVVANNYSGPRELAAHDSLHFNIRILVTPFKLIDTDKHFNTRFVHKYVPVDSVDAWGGTVVNIHHANEINPYINYPFYNLEKQTAYIEEAHSKGIKVKLYNTIRELTYRAHEFFPMRSLGYEIFNDGDGGGHSWLQEHVESNYHSAWHAWRADDASILNKGTSRWTNYYVEGLNWLAENQQIDGLYLDDIAFSRETVKRMVAVLDDHRDEVVIDLHSANQFNPRDGHINSAMLYMEHFPFISRLWFGEYFDYDADPEYWLTELSGIPFGLMGEMLQDCGRPYRGMLYGMTTRMYGNCDPRSIWQLFDDFGIADSRMLGYWLDSSPVTTDNKNVLATTYVHNETALVVLASWEEQEVEVGLSVDWLSLGLDSSRSVIRAPIVDGLQSDSQFDIGESITVSPGGGKFILIEQSE